MQAGHSSLLPPSHFLAFFLQIECRLPEGHMDPSYVDLLQRFPEDGPKYFVIAFTKPQPRATATPKFRKKLLSTHSFNISTQDSNPESRTLRIRRQNNPLITP